MGGMNDSLPLLISLSFMILKPANFLKKDGATAQLSHDIQFRAELKRFLRHL